MANHPGSVVINDINGQSQTNDPLNQYLVELEEAVRLLRRD